MIRRIRAIGGHTLVRRTALFSLSIGASTVVGVFTIPVLIGAVGASDWGILAVLQAIAAFFSFVIAFGWGATGPSMVAGMQPDARRQYYWDSMLTRGALAVLVLPLAIGIGMAVTGRSLLTVSLAIIAYVMPGLGAGWFFVGTNQPGRMFALDSLPPIIGSVGGLVAVVLVPSLDVFLGVMTVSMVVGVLVAGVVVMTRTPGPVRWWIGRARLRQAYAEQLPGVTSSVAASFYTSAPAVLVQLFAPAAVPVYAIADRLFRYAVLVLAPILQSIQSWVPESGHDIAVSRARHAVWLSFGVGAAGMAGLVLFAPLVSDWLTHGEAVVPLSIAVAIGIAFAGEAIAQITGLSSLVVLGATRYLAVSSVVGALAGSVGVLLLTPVAGALGAFTAIAVASLLLGLFRARRAFHLIRERRSPAS